jgi:hypothetical protein
VFIHTDQNYTHWVLGCAKNVYLISSLLLKCTQLELYLFLYNDLQKRQVVSVLKSARRLEDLTKSDRGPVAPRVLDFGIRPRKAVAVTLRSLYAKSKSPLQDERIRGPDSRTAANSEEK